MIHIFYLFLWKCLGLAAECSGQYYYELQLVIEGLFVQKKKAIEGYTLGCVEGETFFRGFV